METHLLNKFLHAHWKSHVILCYDNLTNQRTDLVHSIYMLFCSFWNAWGKSVIKVFLYNYCFTWLRSQTAASSSESNDCIYCYVCSLKSKRKSFIIYENSYIQWLLLFFFEIFSASLSGSDDFVLFDSLDGNGALFANVLCNIPVLRIS